MLESTKEKIFLDNVVIDKLTFTNETLKRREKIISNFYFKKITAGFSMQLLIASNLSDGQLRMKHSFMGHVTLLF
ncbi:MAG: hypothetical protein LCH67_16955 [Bacteroidetes bacterium]|nr:hypothetical protein [Bacteroidota bacterium]